MKIRNESLSLAERVNRKLMTGYIPSPMAKNAVGNISSKSFNRMMSAAVAKYNSIHKEKIFE